VRARFVAAIAAVLAVAGLTVWGVASASDRRPASAGGPGAHVTTSSPSPSPLRVAVPSSWHLRFHPRFTGTHLDTSVWGTCYPWAATGTGCTNHGNGEYEWYLPAQDHVSGGLLYLTARRAPTRGLDVHGKPQRYQCRSGMVTTFPSFQFEYGIVQIVARMPSVKGMWPALWLASANKHPLPEIDIVEHWVRPTYTTGVFLHALGTYAKIYAFPTTANLAIGWHTFSLVWTQHKLAWLIDGRLVMVRRHYIPHQKMYLIANLADARMPSTGGCGGSFVIKSVKIWQKKTQGSPPA
jgi:beta-glucanase (GH16 family)